MFKAFVCVLLCIFSWEAYSKPSWKVLDPVDTSPMLFNGTRSIDGEFEPMGWIGNCTGTLVAPDVLITAAHCTQTGAQIVFSHRGTGRNYAATCTNHPRYNQRTVFNDYAFCKLSTPVEGAQLATLDLSTEVSIGERVLMNGMGAPNVRTHFWGLGTVSNLSGQDIITCGPAKLGGGDSGGSLLRWTDDRKKTATFIVVGVNSRADIAGNCSYFNKTTHPEFRDFVTRYESSNGVRLCGSLRRCPTAPITPTECASNQANLNKLLSCASSGKKESLSECRKAIDETKSCYEKLTTRQTSGVK